MNSKSLDFMQCEYYLSTFGKRVLQNLIKVFEERNQFNKIKIRDRCNCGQNKRVLHFGESSNCPSLISCQQNVSANVPHSTTFTNNRLPLLDSIDVEFPVVTTFDGLLNIPDKNVITEEVTGSHKENKYDMNDKPGIVLPMTEQCNNMRVLHNTRAVKDYVEWDDIFDTQLLKDLNVLDADINTNAQKDISEKNHFFELGAAYKNNSNCSQIERIENQKTNEVHFNVDGKESNIFSNAVIKKNKTKRSSSDSIMNIISKKFKNSPVDSPRNSFRKQKYTKAVKTWINNVEHENLDHTKEIQINKLTTAHPITAVTNKQDKRKNTKKNIQAQLTNKGGIMKFGKPVPNELLGKTKNITTENNVCDMNDKVNNKRVKSKFVAPVKSNIPVKDLSYNIIYLNDDNFETHVSELSRIKNNEIHIVLTFSNGFCQLNSHYTNDTCVVEGTMFQINNVIFYWKDIYKTFCDTLDSLITTNTIVCYDGKSLLKHLASQHNIDVVGAKLNIIDVQIGGNLIDPDNPAENFTELQKVLSFVPEYTISTECVQQKCAWYLTTLGQCFTKLCSLLFENGLWKVFVEIEMRVLPIVADMERRGVRVDTERLKSMEYTLLSRMKATEQACHAAAGRVFQVNSAPQVRAILYEELQLDVKSNVRIRETLCKGEKSTSESMLRSLMGVHPLPKLILEYRHVHKAHATFLAGIANQANGGVVRPTWEQAAAVTGRIACSNPNLQAIPKAAFSLELFPEDGNEEEYSREIEAILNFRCVYLPGEGRTLLAADFRHIECRVFAHAAADTGLLDALASPDLFRVLAARWLNKSEEDVSQSDRGRTKRIVYASLYGAGPRKLAEILDVSYDQTLSIMASFNRTFPSLKTFGRAVVAECERHAGRLRTLCGRGRTFHNMFSGDLVLKSHAERQAINFIVQGTAADLCKRAMVVTEERLRGVRPVVRGRLLLQIHDELVWEVVHEDVERAAGEVKSAMEGVGRWCGMTGKLPVALSVGRTWGEMRQFTPAPPTSLQ